jgi:proteic killer suppression protein
VIRTFADPGTEDIFDGKNSSPARRACPRSLWNVAYRRLDQLDSATELEDLRIPPRNRLEALRGDRRGQYSIRINDQYRICFTWTDAGPEDVEIVDYHK